MPLVSSTVVTRWTRFGHDRLYVTDVAGTALGWVDLRTGRAHPSSPEHEAEILAACSAFMAGTRPRTDVHPTPPAARPFSARPEADSGHAVAPEVESVAPPSEAGSPASSSEQGRVPWTDLAQVEPGAAVRAQAVALRRAAPVRTALAHLLGLRTAERAWRVGARGEELVAAQLRRLIRTDPRWHVLHAVPVGTRGADIDHLVVGPGGVFSLNAKHHPGAAVWIGGDTVLVNGARRPYVRNSRHEAARAARLLTAACGFPVSAQGVVVFVRADRIVVKSMPSDVTLLRARRLRAWLRSRSQVLDEDAAALVLDVARRSTTWEPAP